MGKTKALTCPKCGTGLYSFCPKCRGSITSDAKKKSSRVNGKLGGRPRKKKR